MSASGPPRSTYHHGELRAALVTAGLAILRESGDPAALSLREAARRAGVSAMAPYRHFPDKDALLAAIATVGFERLREALAAADGASEPMEALIAQGVAYVGFAHGNAALFRLMFSTAPTTRPEALARASEAAYAMMADRVATLVPPDAAPDRALQCWATAHGIAALGIDGLFGPPTTDLTGLADRILRLCGVPIGP